MVSKIIQPNDPEFNKVLAGAGKAFKDKVKDLDAEELDFSRISGATEVKFVVDGFPKFEAHHTIIKQSESISKIVFHFKKLSLNMANKLGKFLLIELTRKMRPTASIDYGTSPVFRDQWDLILFHVPVFEVQMIHDRILKLVNDFSANS